ncbi:Rrf2 family transcriptional regulator [Robertmurraya yapensis]|uniref:Rrf2 family transcriptional regulator n=1 Tax=Bacillus yapensis TaxID=2492960 RepID=A0A3S0IKG6_9BACI|nr:Rrf2 family transcriptional regulator [Bacillus yapensis]RTR36196.1 Rrf2 family transcriptional regulator [Bacillus yapensis]TKT05699.1 Rrf2 family transcriptional regulator [Bacillus yapensis]
MSISSRFAVGVHILTLIEFNKDGVSSSEYLAESVNTNPALIRKIIGMLKKAELVDVHPGIAGANLAKKLSEITLLDVYKAVNVVPENELFSVHENPNPKCLVGRNIQETIIPILSIAQIAMEKVLGSVTIEDIFEDIVEKEKQK